MKVENAMLEKVQTLRVDLVDIGSGNIGSVKRCLERLGVPYQIVDGENQPDGRRPLVLPGVGAFGTVMQALRQAGLDATICRLVKAGTPYLGICVGMQILFDGSEESPGIAGLSILPGQVRRFQTGKVPQIGWNCIAATKADTGCSSGFVYFVNSYYPEPLEFDVVSYQASYAVPFCAAVQSGNVTAFQFHPEKSGEFGARLLARWIENVSCQWS